MSPIHHLSALVAHGRTVAAGYGTGGITKWLQNNIVVLLIVVIGVVLLLAAQKANVSKVVTIVGLGLIGLFWLGLAATGNANQVGTFLANLVRS